MQVSSSSYLPLYVSQWRAHSRVVVLHTLHRGQRDTRICPYLINCTNFYPLTFPHLRESSVLIPLLYFSIPSLSASVSDVSLAPSRSIPNCFHHRIPPRSPWFLSAASQRSRSGRVSIYCASVLFLRQIYVFIGSNPASALSTFSEVYSQFPYILCRRSHPVSRRATWHWKPPMNLPMKGGNHPRLHTKEQHQWDGEFKERYGHPWPCHLPDQYPYCPPPNGPGLCHIPCHRRPVIIRRWYHSPQILEGQDHL